MIATIVCVVLYRRRHIADAALLPVVLGGAELLNLVLKISFHRDRPEHGVVHLDTYSYPSGRSPQRPTAPSRISSGGVCGPGEHES